MMSLSYSLEGSFPQLLGDLAFNVLMFAQCSPYCSLASGHSRFVVCGLLGGCPLTYKTLTHVLLRSTLYAIPWDALWLTCTPRYPSSLDPMRLSLKCHF
jgi:hypothetical protein